MVDKEPLLIIVDAQRTTSKSLFIFFILFI